MAVALDRYGRMQRDLAPHLDELLATGAHDMRPAIMPERFEQALVAASEHVERRGSAADRHALERLEALRPTVARWCELLDRMPGAPSLDHNDLHPGNVLTDEHGDVGHARFYDWGDAVLAHPFASMLATLQFMRTYAGSDGTQIRRLRGAYLAAFADLAPAAELIETLELACRVGHIARALTWERAIRADPGFDEQWERAPFDSLVALLDDRPSGERLRGRQLSAPAAAAAEAPWPAGRCRPPPRRDPSPAPSPTSIPVGPGRRAVRCRPCRGPAPRSP